MVDCTRDNSDLSILIKQNEQFGLIANGYIYSLQYIGSDSFTRLSPKVRFRDLDNAETIEYRIDGNGLFAIKLGGESFDFQIYDAMDNAPVVLFDNPKKSQSVAQSQQQTGSQVPPPPAIESEPVESPRASSASNCNG